MTHRHNSEIETVSKTSEDEQESRAKGERPTGDEDNFERVLEEVRTETADYTNPAAAYEAGYVVPGEDEILTLDRVVEEGHLVCGLGIQFLKRGFFDGFDSTDPVDVTEPAVLVYGVADGDLILGAVEYLVPKTGPYNSSPPEAFDAGIPGTVWREDDPAEGLWSLHVWAHSENPAGVFSPTNPRPQFSPDGCHEDRTLEMNE